MKIYAEFNLANWPKMIKLTEINLSTLIERYLQI